MQKDSENNSRQMRVSSCERTTMILGLPTRTIDHYQNLMSDLIRYFNICLKMVCLNLEIHILFLSYVIKKVVKLVEEKVKEKNI